MNWIEVEKGVITWEIEISYPTELSILKINNVLLSRIETGHQFDNNNTYHYTIINWIFICFDTWTFMFWHIGT